MTEATIRAKQTHSSVMTVDNTQTSLCVRLYLGGSFDPPHHAHLALLTHAYNRLAVMPATTDTAAGANHNLLIAKFLPTARSPLKTTSTDPKHRLTMLQLACAHLNKQAAFINCIIKPITSINPIRTTSDPNANINIDVITAPLLKTTNPSTALPFAICEQELWRPPPTYTIDTLQALRDKHPKCSLIFIVGADSIASLSQWRDGDRLTEFAHLWIMPRDALQTPEAIRALLPTPMQHQVTQSLQALQQATHGHIYIDTQQVAAISSSQIRQAITHQHYDFVKSALPHSVYSYIMANQLYQ